MEDPFYLVRDDVVKALAKLRGLYQRRSELESVPATAAERTWTESELCNALRSIEWDVEDLQETIGIVEKNQKQFRLSEADLQARRSFVKATRDELDALKERLSLNRAADTDRTARQELEEADELPPAYNPLLEQPSSPPERPQAPAKPTGGSSGGGYSRLREDEPPESPLQEQRQQQRRLAGEQQRHLDRIGQSVGTLRDMSQRLGTEVDDQSIMIEDITHEVDAAQGKVDTTMSRMMKVLRISNDKRQWTAIGVLSGIMLIVVLMFFFI
ncbi:syntaxin-6-like isoform X1 [Amphibalanus amphitrite]|uniref:syntaxin-6-like isoform X1 n=1 Tax=Amphibalanus amphitrite TaxID=1232801 RepID=UPI001C8FCFBE|nr:syntaxin-6-like isoform X1 [Amphibalanus amphitrite]XP_043235204.1 syntaxin-6-like isoform X1 [Amphibalanus amphitrite]